MPDDNAGDRRDPISDPGSTPGTDPGDARADEPAYAGAPSSESRMRRLARRPRDGALLAGVAAAVLLLGGLGATSASATLALAAAIGAMG